MSLVMLFNILKILYIFFFEVKNLVWMSWKILINNKIIIRYFVVFKGSNGRKLKVLL